MSGERHRPTPGDKFWDGQEKPQPNGRIIWIDWQSAPEYEDKELVVEFWDSYHRRTYTIGEVENYWVPEYNMYELNEADFDGGFHLNIPDKAPTPEKEDETS